MRLGLISAKYPYGPQEPYLDAELRALAPAFAAVAVIPATPDVASLGYADVPADVVRLPLFGPSTLARAARITLRSPLRVATTLVAMLVSSRRPRVAAKNLAVFVKGVAVADVARERRLDHLHAYWLSTPATVAWIAARIAGIGFSATAHRWDVYENNMAARKVRDATFVRTISARGRRDLLARTGGDAAKVHMVRLGVSLAAASSDATAAQPPSFRACRGTPVVAASEVERQAATSPADVTARASTALSATRGSLDKLGMTAATPPLRILCAAALVPVKGHGVLLAALARLRDAGTDFTCTLAGDGPHRAAVAAQIDALELAGRVHLAGRIPHDDLLAQLAGGAYDVSVLASIEREGGLMEGVPVALIEAMAAGVVVVATDSGSIAELVDGQTGLLVPHSDPAALAGALATLAGDPALRDRLRAAARERVEAEFDLLGTTAQLRGHFGV